MGLDPKSLHVGQAVTVHELNYGVQINSVRDGETGLTVLAVDREHLVLDDAAGGTQSIPLYLIQKSAPTGSASSEAA